MIIASAIKLTDNRIFVGKRHTDATLNALEILGLQSDFKFISPIFIEDGFITSELKFLNRKEALIYAKEHNQFRRDTSNGGYDGEDLYSEDLW